MGRKKQLKAARKAEAARREETAEMNTEPFSPPAGADLAEGTAVIAPVTPEMMEHAAHEAAERADAIAHEAPAEAAHEPSPDSERSEPDVAPAPEAEAAPDAAEAATAPHEAVARAASGLEPSDLAFTHRREASEQRDVPASQMASETLDGFGRYNAKVLEIAAGNIAATGELVSALLAAKSVPEAAAINADHMRRRLDALTTQGRDLLLLTQKLALETLRSSGESFRKR